MHKYSRRLSLHRLVGVVATAALVAGGALTGGALTGGAHTTSNSGAETAVVSPNGPRTCC